jgi:hypothetical protein
LKQQLLAAIDSMYICSLQDPMYGYARVTVHDILEHLDNTYGALDQVELNKNMQTLEEPWEPTESMEPLWHRAVVAQQVAQAGADPITDATLLRKFHQVLTNTGVFTLDLRDWDKKPDADKTWNNFRAHFTAANKERIKTATARDLHAAYAADGNRDRATTSTAGTSTTITRTNGTTWAYCWTHGYGTNAAHNSRTCTNKATGHQEDATIENMMGGNNTIRRKRGERNKFRQLNPQQPRNRNNANENNNRNNEQANNAVANEAAAAAAAAANDDDGSQG